jgi:alpha-glucosidase (family GH31 glycosyl hydrolase)
VVRVQHCLTLAGGERLYGTGERFDRLDRRGTVVLNTVYNEYKQQGDRTYLPVPLLLSLWPDPRGMVQELHARGLRVRLWQIPVWKHMGGIRHAQHDRDEAFLIEQGYVVKRGDGSPYRIPEGWFAGSLLIDFISPEAVAWWLAKRRYLLEDLGIDGFKTDGSQAPATLTTTPLFPAATATSASP